MSAIEFCKRHEKAEPKLIELMQLLASMEPNALSDVYAFGIILHLVAGNAQLHQEACALLKANHPLEKAKALHALQTRRDIAVAQARESIESLEQTIETMQEILRQAEHRTGKRMEPITHDAQGWDDSPSGIDLIVSETDDSDN